MQALTSGERERLAEIKQAIDEHAGVTSIQSTLVYKPVSTRIPSSVSLQHPMKHSTKQYLSGNNALKYFDKVETNDALLERDVLTCTVSEELLENHFKALLKIANNKNHPLFKKLDDFF